MNQQSRESQFLIWSNSWQGNRKPVSQFYTAFKVWNVIQAISNMQITTTITQLIYQPSILLNGQTTVSEESLLLTVYNMTLAL